MLLILSGQQKMGFRLKIPVWGGMCIYRCKIEIFFLPWMSSRLHFTDSSPSVSQHWTALTATHGYDLPRMDSNSSLLPSKSSFSWRLQFNLISGLLPSYKVHLMDVEMTAELLVGLRFCNHLPARIFCWWDLGWPHAWCELGGTGWGPWCPSRWDHLVTLPSDTQGGVRGCLALSKAS